MKLFLVPIVLCLFVTLLLFLVLPAFSQADNTQHNQPTLIVTDNQWGTLHTQKIKAVFVSSAAQICPYFHPRRQVRVVIEHTEDHPNCAFVQMPRAEYDIHITAEVFYWAQFAFQFSHELCHVLCRPELKAGNSGSNQWFEESICECASVFVLRKLDGVWRNNPPFPNLKQFADQNYLRDYSNNLLAPVYCLPKDMTLQQWYAKNSPQLIMDWSKANYFTPGSLGGANGEVGINANRLHARLVGNYLLPFFEASPESWEAVRYLNVGNTSDRLSFPQYLRAWYTACPTKHKTFVAKILTAFGIALPRKPSLRRSSNSGISRSVCGSKMRCTRRHCRIYPTEFYWLAEAATGALKKSKRLLQNCHQGNW